MKATKSRRTSCRVHQNLIGAGINAGAIQKAQAAVHLDVSRFKKHCLASLNLEQLENFHHQKK